MPELRIPEQANWLAQDGDGCWFFYEKPPALGNAEWLEPSRDGKVWSVSGELPTTSDWRTTLVNIQQLREQINGESVHGNARQGGNSKGCMGSAPLPE